MRIALGIEYNGSAFCGWQTQPSGCGVQDALERALSEIAGERIATICAGRTDSGVHALAQVVHFDCNAARPDSAWVRGTNTLMPAGAAVMWMRSVAAEFNARYAAQERCYKYVLLNHPVRPALNRGRVGWFHAPLDVKRMREAAVHLVGEHDFSAFRSSECQARSPVRDLRQLDVRRAGDYIVFWITANAFLHHMVRNIVGTLVHVGKSAQEPAWAGTVLAGRNRALAAPTFEAAGLYLARVGYHAQWGLPSIVRQAWFEGQ